MRSGRDSDSLAPVAALFGSREAPGFKRALSRRQGDRRPGAQSHIAAASIDLVAKYPGPRAGSLDKQHQPALREVLYDLTSSYLEGRHCELGRFGYSRDGKRDKLQIVFGLLCAADGAPVAVEVFEGNTGDPSTLAAQVAKLKERFGLSRVVLVGDRGMITEARIAQDLTPAGLDWLPAQSLMPSLAISGGAATNGPSL